MAVFPPPPCPGHADCGFGQRKKQQQQQHHRRRRSWWYVLGGSAMVAAAAPIGMFVALYVPVYTSMRRTSANLRAATQLAFGTVSEVGKQGDGEGGAQSQLPSHQSLPQSSSLLPPPSFELWDHTTGTIQLNPDVYRTEQDKPTSLELLQQILHRPDDESVPSSTYPACFEPNLAATKALAEKVIRERRKNKKKKDKHKNNNNNNKSHCYQTTIDVVNATSIGLPILNMGMPKSGSTTLRNFFRRVLGWNASHFGLPPSPSSSPPIPGNTSSATTATVGQEMVRAVKDGLASPFAYIDPTGGHIYQAHTQMDYTGSTQNIFPQIQLLDEIHNAHPHATFVLLFRPVQDWVRSTQAWHKYPFRWANTGIGQDIPGLTLTPEQREARDKRGERIVLTETQLTDWWCHHVWHVREFVKTYPTHSLIELDLYDGDGMTTDLLTKLFGLKRGSTKTSIHKKVRDDAALSIWGTSNHNPTTKRESSSYRAVRRKVKYFELWNHTTNTMPTKLRNDKDDDDDDDDDDEDGNGRVPTSLEILEDVMREYDGGNNDGGRPDGSPSCFRANTPSPHSDTMEGPNPGNVSFPVLHVGLPLVGNDFLKEFFRDCIVGGTVHGISKKVKGGGLVGKKMMEAVRASLPPVTAYFGPNYDDGGTTTGGGGSTTTSRQQLAFTQLDYTSVLPHTGSSIFELVEDAAHDYSSFPQIQLLDEIHEDVPHATFVLPFRGGGINDINTNNSHLEEWIEVAQNFHNFTERWAAMDDLPGLVLTEEQREARAITREQQQQQKRNYTKEIEEGISLEQMEKLSDDQLRDWWCGHVQHIRKYVEYYPTHRLLELDLHDMQASTASLIQWFPQTNTTCLAELWRKTDYL